MGKEIAKMLLQAVVFGIGIEVGKDIYAFLRGRGNRGAPPMPDQESETPDVDENPT